MKIFSESESNVLEEIILNRRDVRGNRFLDKQIPQAELDKILQAAVNAPSVGFSQPWEFVIIKDKHKKAAIKANFDAAKQREQTIFKESREEQYQALKLEGIHEAPINIAVFYKPSCGPVLGQSQMQEAGLYSVVCAVQNMWLMSRALNIGLGWVSILEPDAVKKVLNAPSENQLVAYLCLGYVDHFYTHPELEKLHWEKRKDFSQLVFNDTY